MEKPKVYIETSFISYLTSKPGRDLIIAAHQQISHEWWDTRRKYYQLYTSQLVYEEASKGDSVAAENRLLLLSDLLILELNASVTSLAQNLIHAEIVPQKYVEDAFHIAIATIHGMDYLLTWNCKHIANAVIRKKIEEICFNNGYISPIICTPEELAGE